MKWSPLSLILSVAVLVSSCAATPIPQVPTKDQIINIVQMSSVRLMMNLSKEDGEDRFGICTAFIVDPSHLLTVKHCVGEDLTQNGIPVEVEKTSDSLALLKVGAIMGPPLKIRKEPLKFGEPVVGVGYGFGFMNVFTRFVAAPIFKETEVLLDGLMIPGMSGGAVVDMQGRVVGIVQSGQQGTLTVLCGQEEIAKFLK